MLITTVERRSSDGHSQGRYSVGLTKLLFTITLLLTLGVGQMWAANSELTNGQILYCKVNNTNWSGHAIQFNWYWNSGDWCCTDNGTNITTDYWYASVPNGYTRRVQLIRCKSDFSTQWDWSNEAVVSERSNNNQNCVEITGSNWGGATVSWTTYRPAMSSASVVDNGTSKTGSGTSLSPYQVVTGETIKLSASSVSAVSDNAMTAQYKYFNKGSQLRDYSSTNTYSFTAGAAGTTYEITVKARNNYASGNGSESGASTTLYYTVIAEPEATHEVTISYKCGGTTIKSSDTEDVGEETASSIDVVDIAGYNFSSWSLGNGLTNESGSTTADPISITTKASGTYTLTANYTEDLTSTWHIIGEPSSIIPNGWTANNDNMLAKATGHSTDDEGSLTINVKTLPENNSDYQFKVYDDDSDTPYGWSNSDYYYMNRAATKTTGVYSADSHPLYFIPDALGNYIFSVDWSSSNPSLTVTFPTAYTVTYGKGTGGGTVTAKYSNTAFDSGTKVQSGQTVRFTQTASTGYQFKEWNTNSSGTGTQLSTNSSYYNRTVASTNNVYAIYNPKQYSIPLNDQDATTAVSPTSVNATYKSLTLSSSITNPKKNGYTFGGWYSAVGGGGYLIINTSGALQASKSGYTNETGWIRTSGDNTVYAKWTQVLNLDKNGGTTDGSLTVIYKKTTTSSHTAATRTGYTLTGYYDDDDGGNKIINAGGTLVSYSASVSSYIRTDGSWGYNGTPELYAHWTPKNYTLSFDGGKGSRPGTVTNIQANVTVTYDDDNFNCSGTPVSTVAIPALTGYTFGGYYTAADGGGTQIVAANGSWIVPGSGNGNSYLDDGGNWVKASNTTLYAKWTEITHTVTLANGGHGHVEINSSTVTSVSGVGIATASGTITAVPDLGYYFTGWTGSDINNGVTIASGSTSTASITITATADSKTITANFASIWALVGTMNSWNDATNRLGNYSTVSTKDYGYVDIDLAANTRYSFKLKDVRVGDGTFYKPTSSNTEITYANKATAQGMNNTAGGDPNQTIMTAGKGSYRFTWNMTDHSIKVTYPDSYTVTFGSDGHGTVTASVESSGAITTGKYAAAGKDITFSQTPNTGYELKGWYTTPSGNTAVTGMGKNDPVLDDIAANANVYAQYNAKTYTVTLDQQSSATGYGSSGDGSLTATYDAAFPSATMPTAANGYAFMGYYSATGGGGTQFTNASGALLANIEGYSDASGHWKYDASDLTLYAYYKKAEITALTLDAAVVATNGTVGVTPTVSPTPTGDTKLCFYVFYSNDNPLSPQPEITWNGTKATFDAGATSGTFKIGVALRTGLSCGGGTLLDSTTVSYQVAGIHSVTVRYQDSDGNTIQASGSVTGKPLAWSEEAITAPDIFGYTFHHWVAGDGVTLSKDGSTDHAFDTAQVASIYIKAVYDGRLTAVYNQKSLIYFKNTLNWSDVYVNFYGDDGYWNNPKGSGNRAVTNRNKHMTRLGETDIWYFDYGAANITPSLYVSFTDMVQNGADAGGHENFYNASPHVQVVYPANYYQNAIHENHASENGFKAATPMFVPLAGQTKSTLNTHADYYNRGYWTKYLPGTGYTLEIYNKEENSLIKSVEFTSEDDLMPMKAVVDLEAGTKYKYQIRRGGTESAGIYLGTTKSGDGVYMNQNTDHANWQLSNSDFHMLGVITSAAGDYTFTLAYANTGNNDDHRFRITVDYPSSVGDFQVLYADTTSWSNGKHTAGWRHPSRVIAARENGKDTISFFVYKGKQPTLYARKVSSINAGTGAITWASANIGASASMSVESVSKTGVYNFEVVQNAAGTAITAINNIGEYTGNYYIRVDAAPSKWDNYKSSDHMMTYSEYSATYSDYTHYYMKFVESGTNVKFVIANDYSACVSDTLITHTYRGGDASHIYAVDGDGHGAGDIKADANIRFMWDIRYNRLIRAYLARGKNDGSKFLVLVGTDSDNILDPSGNALSDETNNNHKGGDHCMQFVDNENWIYEANIKIVPSSYVKLTALFNGSTFYFKGSEGTPFSGSNAIQLMTGDGAAELVRVIYDFKTDRLVAAWQPSGNISTEREINADVMFIREHQGDIEQLTFTESGAITEIKTAYAVLRFNKWTINNKSKAVGHAVLNPLLSRYERDLFYVSFPFRVSMNEVFGFGTYGKHWIIEYYDGAARAANGFWADTPTFWRYVTDRRGQFFEPNQGYIIALDLDEMGEESDVWANDVENVELYFPSYGEMGDITNATVKYTLPEHTCTIGPRPGMSDDRRVKDSHWNVMSVPTYVNTNSVAFANTTWTATKPSFLYEWNSSDNSLTARSGSGYTYHAMHAYTVQYEGEVTWTTSVTPAAAPNRNPEAVKDAEYRLELRQNDQMVDQTFVRLSDDEHVTTGFEFNYDLSKEFNKNKANIYTMVTTQMADGPSITETAGNVLPMSEQTTVVPVGVKIATTGDYTFSIPEGTNGVGVTLIDTEAGVSTPLSALNYTINLSAGTYDNRFVMEISPVQQISTDLESSEISSQNSDVRKVMIDQILYIVKDGVMYDARGARVK